MHLALAALFVMAATAPDAAGWTRSPGEQSDSAIYSRAGLSQTIAQVTPRMAIEAQLAAPAMLQQLVKDAMCPAGVTTNANAEGTVAVSLDADRRCIVMAIALPDGASRVIVGRTAGADRLEFDALLRAMAELADPSASANAPVNAPAPVASATRPPPATRTRPVGAILHGRNVMTGLQLTLTFTVTPWLLYPGGVAAACPHRDPLTLDLDPVALDKLDDCEGGRWRRGAKGIELQDDEGDEWTSSMVWEQQPLAAGASLTFDGTVQGGGSSYVPGSGVAAYTTLSSGRLRLTPDGRIEGTMMTTAGYNEKRRTETGMSGRYRLDGFTIEIVTLDGTTVRRPFVFSDQGDKYRSVNFGRDSYLQPRR